MMEYKGYTAQVEFDAEAGLLHGRVINTRDVITFQGTSVAEVRSAFADSVEDYLAFCASRNEEPEKPFSGKFLLRMEPDLHRAITSRAASDGLSINVWVVSRLREFVTRPALPARWGVSVHPDLATVRVMEAPHVRYETGSQAGSTIVEADTYDA
jgi:predicted HicB family RNase H-like nuclease